MIKRLIALIMAGNFFTVAAMAEDFLTIGNSTFSVPTGWTETNKTGDRLTFATPDGHQQATVSLMSFSTAPSFEDFKKICSLRYKSENEGLTDLTLQPELPAPVEEGGKYKMLFSGEEKKTNRIFSGFLSLQKNELITIYVEGIGITHDLNVASFKIFELSLKSQ